MISTYTSKLKQLQIGDLIAKIPIIQGGMGVGISRSHLAGAVAKEGGVGIISTAQIGYDCGRGRCDYQWSRASHESAGACQQNLPDKDSSDCILEACSPADIEDVGAPL